MRKNQMITGLLAAVVMMTVSACGSKDAATQAAGTQTQSQTGTTASVAAESTENSGEETTESKEETSSDEETTKTEETTTAQETTVAATVGEVKGNGVFMPASGAYEITPPTGWSIDGDSDGEYVTFLSQNGEDMLELTCVSGGNAANLLEVLPDTAEEYKDMVSRDDAMQIVDYQVQRSDDGSQTFKYAVKYDNPDDDIRYMAISGTYNAAAQTYICATGTVISTENGVSDQVQKAVDSLKIK